MALKLNQLKAFSEVARQGSIRAASRELGLSQPAVTKAIRELEESLGANVISRGSQGITLTKCGDSLLQHARLILAELSLAEDSIQQILGSQQGNVSIGVGASIACELLPEVIQKFRQECPKTKIKIKEGQLESHLEQLRNGEIDFAISTYHSGVKTSDIFKRKILDMPFVLVTRKGSPYENARTLAQLQNCDWLLPTTHSSYLLNLFEKMTEQGLSINQSITCESYLAGLNIVAKTDCVALMSAAAIKQSILLDNITCIDLKEPLPIASFYLMHRKSIALAPAAEKLAELFIKQAQPVFKSPSLIET
ncbi:LysR substrate-binding domain-containing protein [Marinomonas sp.]|jgi:LysR family transcriptional regulator, regulator of abg operon|uniref:LysR substrate-binding domain-containing protein n=1 Tax=Marinomonas sp. TaxID=1904862 RepID=UPI003A920FA9